MKFSIFLIAGLASAFTHLSPRDVNYYDRRFHSHSISPHDTFRRNSGEVYDFGTGLFARAAKTTTTGKPASRKAVTAAPTYGKFTSGRKAVAPQGFQKSNLAITPNNQNTPNNKPAGTENPQPSGLVGKDNKPKAATIREESKSSSKTPGAACKLGKRASESCGEPSENLLGNTLGQHDYPSPKNNPNSWELVPKLEPGETEKPMRYPIDVYNIGKPARVITHFTSNPIESSKNLIKTMTPLAVAGAATASTGNALPFVAGGVSAYTTALDSFDSMDKNAKDKAKGWMEGITPGHSMTEMNRMQNIDSKFKAANKAIKSAASTTRSAASKRWGAVKNIFGATSGLREGNSTPVPTIPAGPAPPVRQHTNEFEMVGNHKKRSLDHIQRSTLRRRKPVSGISKTEYLDELIWR